MVSSEILFAAITSVITAPLSALLTAIFLRRKHNAEIDKIQAEINSSKAETRDKELENVKKAMTILMEQIVEPLKKEIHEIRKELTRLRRALDKITGCPYADNCPVALELRRPEEKCGIHGRDSPR